MQRMLTTIIVALLALSACATQPLHSGRGISGPAVRIDPSRLAQSRHEACNSIVRHELHDPANAARTAGMLKQDFDALRETSKRHRVIASFRDSNQACLPHLADGVQSKPHAVLQKTWDSSNLLPGDQHLAGLVSDRMKKPPSGEKIPNPQLTQYNGAPVTCDYDLMDLAEQDGSRIPGESPREKELRGAFNNAIPPTPRGHRDRIMHGSQAGYGEYAALHADETVITGLFKPEAPLTAFSSSGTIYRLETVESVLDFYRCYQITLPDSWNIHIHEQPRTQ